MRKTLTANQAISFAASGTRVLFCLISGDVKYKPDSAVTGDSDEAAYVLDESARTDGYYIGNKPETTFHIKAGASGANIQYRVE